MVNEPSGEAYICVDVETSGPIPGDYSLLSIGACTLYEPQQTFYIELQPTTPNATQEAFAVHKLSIERLKVEGIAPSEAIRCFEDWLKEQTPTDQAPVFVAFNAPFDWMFVNYYFMHYLGRNPFGHAALDIKAFYMGMAGSAWTQTSWRHIDAKYKAKHSLVHHALQDALDQAEMFKRMLEDSRISD
ncbi:MAG: hypothetical protein A2136_07970 [Chloroflexi bacterium RBG_16_54_11]|nr:MAG: hypothetical protein A2136_07970 [Chloroflexi bacterium RBG_16_54_11]